MRLRIVEFARSRRKVKACLSLECGVPQRQSAVFLNVSRMTVFSKFMQELEPSFLLLHIGKKRFWIPFNFLLGLWMILYVSRESWMLLQVIGIVHQIRILFQFLFDLFGLGLTQALAAFRLVQGQSSDLALRTPSAESSLYNSALWSMRP